MIDKAITDDELLKAKNTGNDDGMKRMLEKAGNVWEGKVKARDDAFNLAYAPDATALEFDDDALAGSDSGVLGKQSRWDSVQEAFLRFYVVSSFLRLLLHIICVIKSWNIDSHTKDMTHTLTSFLFLCFVIITYSLCYRITKSSCLRHQPIRVLAGVARRDGVICDTTQRTLLMLPHPNSNHSLVNLS